MKEFRNPGQLPKLVRGRIPEIKKGEGENPIYRTAEEDEILHFLQKKLLEEAEELLQESTNMDRLEELIDVVEVVETIKAYLLAQEGLDEGHFSASRADKNKRKGDFSSLVIYEGDAQKGE